MEAARFLAIFVGVFVAILCSMLGAYDPSGNRQSAAQARRMAEHRMNARLLKLNL
jgi:hypothetical protein